MNKELTEITADLEAKKPLPSSSVPRVVKFLLDPEEADLEKVSFLRALTNKREDENDLAAFTQAILPYAVKAPFQGQWKGQPILDCCGTGGGGLSILNVSTASMFVMGAAGIPVVKHGNRGVTKISGSADVLKHLRIPISQTPEELQKSMDVAAMAFVFAPAWHPSFKVIAPIRKKMAEEGLRTIFNLLGPLLNPVRPQNQIIGLFCPEHVGLFHRTLAALGVSEHLVVCGFDAEEKPIGEVSVCGENICEGVGREDIESFSWREQTETLDSLKISSAQESAERITTLLQGKEKQTLAQDLIAANAAAGIFLEKKTSTFSQAFDMSLQILESGSAWDRLRTMQEIRFD